MEDKLSSVSREAEEAQRAAAERESALQARLRDAESSGDKKMQRFAERTAKVRNAKNASSQFK